MNKKISLGLCLSLVILSITATFAVTMIFSKQIYNKIISNISQRSQTYDSVDEISRIISNYFYGKVDDYSAIGGALAEGYVNGLGDEYSKYLEADEYAEYTEKIESGLTGCGIETVYSSKKLVISYVYEGSPAETAGLKKGDIITKVNTVAVTKSNYEALRSMLYGGKLSTISLEYQRDGETKTAEPMLGFSIPSVTGSLMGNVGYIKINGFFRGTANELEETYKSLKEKGASCYVFDVRGVSEGTVDYAAATADIVVTTSQPIASIYDKDGQVYKNKKFTNDSGTVIKENAAVLVDGETKGPAELFAFVVKNASSAELYGSKTAGNGTYQDLFTLDGGGAVLLTVAEVRPLGSETPSYKDVGITPDHLITDDSDTALLDSEDDKALQAAIADLSNKS